MIGYAYLDLDLNLVYKLKEYIEEDNPGFFSQNSHLLIKRWKFDTELQTSMRTMFSNINDYMVPKENVRLFVQIIGYDLNRLKDAS